MKKNLKVHFSSATDQWETPQEFFDKINAEHGPFELDVAADYNNAKCPIYYGTDSYGAFCDGLVMNWDVKRAWMNPPYGRGIGEWVKKAYEESKKGCKVVCLLPSRTDTKWFHEYCTKGQITFLKGRLKFGGSKNSAPFPSMVVVFGGDK